MNRDDIDVRRVATLARLAIADEEVARYARELGAILDHVAALAELPTADVPATARVVPGRDAAREDEIAPGLDREAFLGSAPDRRGDFVRVPRILAEGA